MGDGKLHLGGFGESWNMTTHSEVIEVRRFGRAMGWKGMRGRKRKECNEDEG